MVMTGFVGLVTTTDFAGRAAALSVADATYQDVLSGYITLDEVINYWKSEPISAMFDLEDVLVQWESELTVTAKDEMVEWYEANPTVVAAYSQYATLAHPTLIAQEESAASSIVDIGSVQAEIVLTLLDAVDFVSNLAQGEDFTIDFSEYSSGSYDINEIYSELENYHFIRGDANGDREIDVQDVTLIKLAIYGEVPATPFMDANNDGKVSLVDCVAVKLLIVGDCAYANVMYVS